MSDPLPQSPPSSFPPPPPPPTLLTSDSHRRHLERLANALHQHPPSASVQAAAAAAALAAAGALSTTPLVVPKGQLPPDQLHIHPEETITHGIGHETELLGGMRLDVVSDAADAGNEEGAEADDEDEAVLNLDMPPPPDDTYPTLDAAQRAIETFAVTNGYSIVRRRSKRGMKGKGPICKVWLACTHGGVPRRSGGEGERKRRKMSRRVGCPWACVITRTQTNPSNYASQGQNGNSHTTNDTTNIEKQWKWETHCTDPRHNHSPDDPLATPESRQATMTSEARASMQAMRAAGVVPKKIIEIVQQQHPGVQITPRDVYNIRVKGGKVVGPAGSKAKEKEGRVGKARKTVAVPRSSTVGERAAPTDDPRQEQPDIPFSTHRPPAIDPSQLCTTAAHISAGRHQDETSSTTAGGKVEINAA